MTPPQTGNNMAVVIERLEMIRCKQDELSDGIQRILDWRREFETSNAVEHSDVKSKVEASLRKGDDHERRIVDLEKAIAPLVLTNRILAFLASGLVLSIMALIWSILTGQVNVVYP